MPSQHTGKVWLVGAGPGDPDLLTLKAHRLLMSADLILFDKLVSQEIRGLFPKSVPAFYVGKEKGNHSLSQTELNALMIKRAREGYNIVRLKGGDPFVFGRGGEEILTLMQAGIEAEVVPGITAASGCSSYAGIPLTHRGLSQGCTFITAHGESELNIEWQSLASSNHTLVFYMGVSKVSMIKERLLDKGMCPTTPLAIIENGCRSNQRTLLSTLSEVDDLVRHEQVSSPSIIVVGKVTELALQLNPQFWSVNTEQSAKITA